jgi:hypothetical protein
MAKTLFDHINEIYQSQKKNYFFTLDDGEKRTYSAYMVNRFLSMNIHQLPLVNEIQKYSLPNEAHYLFFATTIPRGKQYNKYVKAVKETKYEAWLVTLVAKHYCVSEIEAISYLEIYYRDNKSGLRELCEKYGIDPKAIKKVKL